MCAGRQRRTFATVNDAGRRSAYRSCHCLAGPISFIALVAPHIARRISGTARWGLTQAALCGALLLLVADLCAQQLFMPYQLPVGVVTVSLGGIYLIVLLIQESRKK